MDITEIPGFFLGHHTDVQAGTGCTVVCCPEGATGAVDVRGGAPATRETDLLRPEETVDKVHAVVLSGGSAFGLAAASGVAVELEGRDIGLDVGVARVPIVCGACVFDLAVGDPSVRPGEEAGAAAVKDALDSPTHTPLARGNIGAGTGCTVGKLAGFPTMMKGGLGTACIQEGDLLVGAVVAVNACGDIVDPQDNAVIAGVRPNADSRDPLPADEALGRAQESLLRLNTTISCVITNARLTKAQATKVAQMAADGYAHAIRPCHTTQDGDALFVLSHGAMEAPLDTLGVLASQAVERAIVDGVLSAHDAYGVPGAAGPIL